MSTYTPIVDDVSGTYVYSSTGSSDGVMLLPGLFFYSFATEAIQFNNSNQHLINMTTLLSSASYAVYVDNVDDCDIINMATGTITTTSTLNYAAVSMSGDRNTLQNAGTVLAVNGIGVFDSGNLSVITNTGTIQGLNFGINAAGTDCVISNSGLIEGGNALGSIAVGMAGVGNDRQLFNSGVIQSLAATSGPGVEVIGSGIATIHNAGTIRSVGNVAVSAALSSGALYLTNSGTILSSANYTMSVEGSIQADIIINTGSINRSVGLGDGDDLFDGIGGFVGGTLFGGNGNDVFRVSDAGAVISEAGGQGTDRIDSTVSFGLAFGSEVENLTLLGTATDGSGNEFGNFITGNGMDNHLSGGAGLDALYGGLGNDLLDGGTEGDFLFGEAGDDILLGKAGADSMNGNDGDDWLAGGAGFDTITGEAGNDSLHGGLGRDTLTGGEDADTFVFLRAAETGTTSTTRDTIIDFEAGLDVLDLTGIDARAGVAGNQAFSWLGSGAFTGVAGQLRFVVSGTAILVEGTVDADLVADFSIRLNSLGTIAVDDILL